jgi:hypothetical protein
MNGQAKEELKQTMYGNLSPEGLEVCAALAHEQWAGWMRYMFSKGEHNPDGSWTMPEWAVQRWTRQMESPYEELPEDEKESDRKEARRWLALFGISVRSEGG